MALSDFEGLLREAIQPSLYELEKLPYWLRVRRRGGPTQPQQGWKLHLSAFENCAEELLRRALTLLIGAGVDFKLAPDVAALQLMNAGGYGASQRGKFVTVYPPNETEAVRLARALDAATSGIVGPPIPTDRRLRPDSIVHYRYGSFSAGHMQSKLGLVLPCVVAPSGERVPDIRTDHYVQPDWVTDPFGGVDARPEIPVFESRYVAVARLHQSMRGMIWLAADLDENRPVVLKQYVGSVDERSLERERDLLLEIAGPRFPRLLDYFASATDGTETLVLEDLQALTLEEWVHSRDVSGADARNLMLGIIVALEELHARGIVHRDVKSTNVMLRDPERLFLIDFELSQRRGASGRRIGRGTMGFASKQQWNLAPASEKDDIYALGAVLYLLLTGAEPSAAPDPWSLLDRDPLLMNAEADPLLIDLAGWCLSFDPDMRPTLRQVREVLEGGTVAERCRGSRQRARQWREEDCSAERWLEYALMAADSIVRDARQHAVTLWWHGKELEGLPTPSLGSGDAGTLLALTEVAAVSGWQDHLETVHAAAERLPHTPRAGGAMHPGLYVGEAGVALALLRAGEVLDKSEFVQQARRIAREVANAEHFSPDLYNGTAGRIRLHFRMHETTGDERELAAVISGAEYLLREATWDDEGGCSWVIPEGFGSMTGQALLGYAHGAAGIADVLCDVWEATGDKRLERAIRGAYRWIMKHAATREDGGASLYWSVEPQGPSRGSLWCHGSTGVGQFLLRYAKMPFSEEGDGAWNAVRGAAAAVAKERKIGAVLCHGLAGNIEFLLDVYEHTTENRWRQAAQELSQLLMAFASHTAHGCVFVGDKGEPTPNYMTGYAGIALTLLRLAGRRPGTTQTTTLRKLRAAEVASPHVL